MRAMEDGTRLMTRLLNMVKMSSSRSSVQKESSFVKLRHELRAALAAISSSDAPAGKYDFSKSTAENHTLPVAPSTWAQRSAFGSVRKGLDTEYHGVYSAARQKLQDRLVTRTLECGVAPIHPWLFFTAGPMGAGKSHVVKWMHRRGYFLTDELVHVDPDIFKEALPEWNEYVARDRSTAGTLTHRESGMLVEIAMEAALAEGKSCWVDGSLKDGGWYRKVISSVKQRYPRYSIAILEVTADMPTILARVDVRAQATGRHVPREDVQASFERVPHSVAQLVDLLSFLAVVDNSGATPVLTKMCNEDVCWANSRGLDWHLVQEQFGAASRQAPTRQVPVVIPPGRL